MPAQLKIFKTCQTEFRDGGITQLTDIVFKIRLGYNQVWRDFWTSACCFSSLVFLLPYLGPCLGKLTVLTRNCVSIHSPNTSYFDLGPALGNEIKCEISDSLRFHCCGLYFDVIASSSGNRRKLAKPTVYLCECRRTWLIYSLLLWRTSDISSQDWSSSHGMIDFKYV